MPARLGRLAGGQFHDLAGQGGTAPGMHLVAEPGEQRRVVGALEAGGEVIGVSPDALANAEVANHDCTQLITVSGMHERKLAFTNLSDGFLTIPGGVGTMDELWEAVSWAQLGYHAKPVGLLNAFGFYDHLLAFNHHMIAVGFIRPAHAGILIAEPELDLLLTRMAAHEPHTPIFAMKTSDL